MTAPACSRSAIVRENVASSPIAAGGASVTSTTVIPTGANASVSAESSARSLIAAATRPDSARAVDVTAAHARTSTHSRSTPTTLHRGAGFFLDQIGTGSPSTKVMKHYSMALAALAFAACGGDDPVSYSA